MQDALATVVFLALPAGLVAWIFFMLNRQKQRRQSFQDAQAAYDAQFEAWFAPLAREAQDPRTAPERLSALAVAAMPADSRGHIGYIEVLRLVAGNPSTPVEIRSGLLSRIGSEEAAVRTNAQLLQMQQHLQQMSRKRGGFVIGGGVSFPLD